MFSSLFDSKGVENLCRPSVIAMGERSIPILAWKRPYVNLFFVNSIELNPIAKESLLLPGEALNSGHLLFDIRQWPRIASNGAGRA